MKVAIYSRVSTPEQDVTKQESLCREYCQRAGHEVFEVYSDNGISGANTNRPAFDQMLGDMRHYRFNAIEVKLDKRERKRIQ